MTELDQAINKAYQSQGKQEDVNQVYLALLRSPLFVPVQKDYQPTEDEPFRALFAKVEENYFMLAFDTQERLTAWAAEQQDQVGLVELMGKDVIAGINNDVFLCLNVGTEFYKEFSPAEVAHLKKIVARLEQMRQ